MARGTKTILLNVSLLKNGNEIARPGTFIKAYQERNKIEISLEGISAFLYSNENFPYPPLWLTDLNEKILPAPIENFNPRNQTSGATLFIEVSNRVFAVNFGTQGRWNIEKEQLEEYFGLYTANKFLLSNSNAKIKSSQSRIHETNPINKKTQYGDEITSSNLRMLLQDNEALKELSVIAKGHLYFPRMVGKINTLSVQIKREDANVPFIRTIPERFNQLLDLYNAITREDIKKLFKDIYPLRDTDTEYTQLNDILTERLLSERGSFFLFEPEIDFDLSAVAEFRIITDAEEARYEELSLPQYLSIRVMPTFDNLKEDRIKVIDIDNRIIAEWTVFECLYGEIEFSNTNYILSQKRWFEVNRDKYQRVNNRIDSILDNNFTIADSVKQQSREAITHAITNRSSPNTRIRKEHIFNETLCSALGGELFDEGTKQIKLYENKFEVCDILHHSSTVFEFIHVKYNSGADAISHLVNQGFVSAKSYAEFTTDYISKVNHFLTGSVSPLTTEYRGSIVRYLIINDKAENRLTFFSKMQIEERVRDLVTRGFIVKLAWVRDAYPPPPPPAAP